MFNRRDALERTGDDLGLLKELAATFVEDGPRMLAVVRKAVVGGDADSLHKGAHTMKGAAATIGGEQLAAFALALEAIGKEERMEQAREVYGELETAYNCLVDALRGFVRE